MRNEDVRRLVDSATTDLISALDRGQSERLIEYLGAMGRFHTYSLGNIWLIAVQRPGATHVAGYRTWQSLGRQVRQGEKGILIVAPIVKRGSRVKGGNESVENRETEEERVVAFRGAYVFDVTQTEGRPLVEFAKVEGNPSHHLRRLRALISGQGIDLAYSDSLGSAYGLSCGGKILIRPGLGLAEEFSVMVHELAHEMLHKQKQDGQKISRKIRETEAEAVAFVVSQTVGLECRTAASDYIQLYDGKKETLMASLERIQATAREIIKAVMVAEDGETETADREVSLGITAVAAGGPEKVNPPGGLLAGSPGGCGRVGRLLHRDVFLVGALRQGHSKTCCRAGEKSGAPLSESVVPHLRFSLFSRSFPQQTRSVGGAGQARHRW